MVTSTRLAATATLLAALLVATSGSATGTPTAAGATDEPTATFTFWAEEGAHPVDGRSGTWTTPDVELMVWEHDNILKVDGEEGFDFIRVELNAQGRVPLAEGVYPNARGQVNPDTPGILVISNGLACGDVYGEFIIDRLTRDASGTLTALDAAFSQSCGATEAPTLKGQIHYQP
jgi:hypothetical protein